MKLCVAVLCFAVTYARAVAQIECTDDAQCHDRQFCAKLVGKCNECVPCGEYNRRPSEARACAESVDECGACLQGFKKLYNRQECVDEHAPTPEESPGGGGGGAGDGGLPAYAWALLVILLVLLSVLVMFLVRWIRPKMFSTTTRESIYNTRGTDAEAPLRASSPPPHDSALPYNGAVNNNHQPSSPPYEKGDDDSAGFRPFIAAKNAMNDSAGKERDSSQEARPFNFPNYVRAPHPPPTYEEALGDESNPAVDEETVPSSWTPEPVAGGDSSNLSVMLREARERTLIRQPEHSRDSSPPAKLPRLLPVEDSVDDTRDDELTTSPASILPALPAATEHGSNMIPLVHAHGAHAYNAHRAERPHRSPSPAPTPPSPPTASATPRETNIVINITQQLNNLVTPKFRFDNEQR